jgi:ribosomal protein S18 acetylase RimI-like enzyme
MTKREGVVVQTQTSQTFLKSRGGMRCDLTQCMGVWWCYFVDVCKKEWYLHIINIMRDADSTVAHVQISPVDSISYTMQEHVERAMYGNKTCSLSNMNTSCFAAERCAMAKSKEVHFPSGNAFVNSTFTLVAHSLRSDEGMRTTGVDNFVGCVCVGPTSIYESHMYPSTLDVSNAHVIYSLCVSNTFQGGGVGRQLVNAARSRISGPLYLFVLNTGTNSTNADIATVMSARVQRLENTYARMGLKRIAHMGSHTLFQVA